MNKTIKLLLLFSSLMLSVFMYGTPITPFSGGAGTAASPYQIATLADLRFLSENPSYWGSDKNFIQTANIDAAETNTWNVGNHDNSAATADEPMGFSPIGSAAAGPFNAKYNGQGFVISNLYINRPATSYVGLFGYINASTAIVRNFGVVNVNVSGRERVGGLVGWNNTGLVSNCYSTGVVKGRTTVGGLVGMNNFGYISNSYSSASVEGQDGVGGLNGQTWAGNVANSYAIGSVSGNVHVGGLVGYLGGNNTIINKAATIDKCYAVGAVTIIQGTATPGGLVGTLDAGQPGVAPNSFWDYQTTGQTTSVAGTSKSTAEMKTLATFSDWDFTIQPLWDMASNINNGYPYLGWQNPLLFSGGSGSSTNPYKIGTLADLRFLSENPSYWAAGKNFIQTDDIDAAETNTWNVGNHDNSVVTADEPMGFSPIGSAAAGSFNAKYNGQGFVISNLYINRPATNYVGLFGYINASTAIISNLGVVNVNVSGRERVGGLLGWNNTGLVSNSYSTGVVKGRTTVGGLVGMNNYGRIQNSYSSASTDGHDGVGGLNGQTWEGSVANSYAIGSVVGNNHVGGLIGYFGGNNAKIDNSYAVGQVTGIVGGTIGGLVGTKDAAKPGVATNSYWDYQTTGQTTSVVGTSKSTAQMKTQATFIDWDFTTTPVWKIESNKNSGYPYLGWQTLSIDAPDVQASALEFTQVYNYNMTISWTNGNGHARVVFVKEGTGAIANPLNKTTYVASNDWAVPGTQLQSSGYYCVYNGTGNSVTVSNLAKNTQYSVQVFEYNGAAGAEVYSTVVGADNPKSQTTTNEDGTGFQAHGASKIRIYPNPIHDAFRIQGLSGVSTLSISDLSGRTMLQQQVLADETIFVESLAKGMYIMKLVNNGKTFEHKIVIK